MRIECRKLLQAAFAARWIEATGVLVTGRAKPGRTKLVWGGCALNLAGP